jgi:membrane-associated phospholipid phosphatase
MKTIKKIVLPLFVAGSILFNTTFAFAAKSRNSPLRSFGDYMQIINPVLASGFASQEKGFGHFAFIFGQTLIAAHGTKLVANKSKWGSSKRPHIDGKKDRFEGMPSAHTASAWAAASYVRTFSEDYKYVSIALYLTAATTGYSRIKAKEHTTAQVIGGAALAELVTYINSKLGWSNDYRSTNFYFGSDELTASFQFRL